MLEYIFKSLLCAGAAGTVLAVLMALVKPLTKKRFPAAWHYYMWIAVVIVMLAPARFNVSLPQIRFAPSDNAPTRIEQSAPIQIPKNDIQTDIAAPVQTETAPVTPTQNEPEGFNFTFETAAWIWFIVAAGLFVWRLAKYWAFIIKLKRNSVAAECSELENYTKRKIPVRESKNAMSPLMVGFFKPRLILPDKDIDADRLGYILRHETTHLRRGDILWKWLVTIAKCVHWFNPAVYFIASRINAECEISCDAIVTRGMSENERGEYINTILSLLTTSNPAPLTTQMSGNAKRLAERFTMINTARRAGKKAAAVSSILAVCVLGAAIFAGGVMADGVLGDSRLFVPKPSKNRLERVYAHRNTAVTDTEGIKEILELTDTVPIDLYDCEMTNIPTPNTLHVRYTTHKRSDWRALDERYFLRAEAFLFALVPDLNDVLFCAFDDYSDIENSETAFYSQYGSRQSLYENTAYYSEYPITDEDIKNAVSDTDAFEDFYMRAMAINPEKPFDARRLKVWDYIGEDNEIIINSGLRETETLTREIADEWDLPGELDKYIGKEIEVWTEDVHNYAAAYEDPLSGEDYTDTYMFIFVGDELVHVQAVEDFGAYFHIDDGAPDYTVYSGRNGGWQCVLQIPGTPDSNGIFDHDLLVVYTDGDLPLGVPADIRLIHGNVVIDRCEVSSVSSNTFNVGGGSSSMPYYTQPLYVSIKIGDNEPEYVNLYQDGDVQDFRLYINHEYLVVRHGVIEQRGRLDEFIDDVDNNRESELIYVNYTIEGAPIVNTILYDGSAFDVWIDTRFDSYGGEPRTRRETYSYLLSENTENGTRYVLSRDDKISDGDFELAAD